MSEKQKQALLEDLSADSGYEALFVSDISEKTRAYIKIQDGCNQFCSYCIIPYARGRIRSRNPQDVLEEVKRLAASGYQEVVLTGIHLSSYGVDLEPWCGTEKKHDFIFLIDEAHNLVERAREMYSAELIKENFLLVKRLIKGKSKKT